MSPIKNKDFKFKGSISPFSVEKNKIRSLILNEKRTASIVTLTFCDLFCLHREDYIRIKEEYPEFRKVLKLISNNQSSIRSEFILDQIIL